MARPDSSAASDPVLERVRQAEPPVDYDVERGLARHRRLVQGGAPLPEWATRGATPPGARWARWLGGAGLLVALGGLSSWLWVSSVPESRPSPAPQIPSMQTGEAAPVPSAPPAVPEHDSTESTPAGPVAGPTRAAGDDGPSSADPSQRRVGADPAGADADEPMGKALSRLGRRAPAPTSAEALRARREARARHDASSGGPPGSPAGRLATGERNPGQPGTDAVRGVQPDDGEEIAMLVRARRLLPVDPLRTLRLAREGNARFGAGYLQQERRYLEIQALHALGRHAEAKALAAWFVQDYPDSPYAKQVQRGAE